jgi:hypothetical protein
MKNTLNIALVAALVSMGCHSKESLNREKENYQVVQEGAATGTTTAVGSVGQTPPITGTNADTTTAFTIAANGVPQQAGTTTAPMMPTPNVGANGAAMPNYPIPPGLARTIGGGGNSSSSASSSSNTARRTSSPEPARRTYEPAPSQPMTSGETASTRSTSPSPSTNTAAPAETTASTPPATDSAAPRKTDDHKAAPAPAPAEDAAPAEEPSTEAPATQTGTFGPL